MVWKDGADGRKGRFVIILSLQCKHWTKGSVRMEAISSFAMDLQRGDDLLSMDIKKGYRQFRLHPSMRDWFMFRWKGRYFQFLALPFGWGRSPLWFTQLMSPFVKELRSYGYRTLAYLDDFLIEPSPYGVISDLSHCEEARERIKNLMDTMGLQRHPDKGEWTGRTESEHLAVRVDTREIRFFIEPRKIAKVQYLARRILREVRQGRRWVTKKAVTHFCDLCVSLTLAMPWARFYTRSLY